MCFGAIALGRVEEVEAVRHGGACNGGELRLVLLAILAPSDSAQAHPGNVERADLRPVEVGGTTEHPRGGGCAEGVERRPDTKLEGGRQKENKKEYTTRTGRGNY